MGYIGSRRTMTVFKFTVFSRSHSPNDHSRITRTSCPRLLLCQQRFELGNTRAAVGTAFERRPSSPGVRQPRAIASLMARSPMLKQLQTIRPQAVSPLFSRRAARGAARASAAESETRRRSTRHRFPARKDGSTSPTSAFPHAGQQAPSRPGLCRLHLPPC